MNAESRRPSSLAVAVIVNDDPTQLQILAGLTRKAGLEPRLFTEAEAALRAMDPGAPPDIVVTDLYMPGIDGWRFCGLLRSSEYSAFNHVPILVVSATFAGEEPRRIAAGIGADAFMGAPVDGRQFAEQLHTLLDGRQPRPHPRALITADTKDLADSLQRTFDAHGYDVDTALTAQDAASAFEKTAYNVAILDHHLSGTEGAALLDAFRARQPDCACLMMTDDPAPELALAWMKGGAAAYVHKPFDPAYLVELCNNARQQQFLLRTKDLLELRTQELKQSEERYRRITQSLHGYVYTVRVENGAPVQTIHGPGCETIIGYSENDFIKEPTLWLRTVAKSDRARVIEQVRAVFSGANPAPIEYRIIRKDGETRWVQNTCVPQYDAYGVLVAYDGLIQDITERKQAEQALAEREEMYHAIVQQMSDELYLHDLGGAFVEVNDAAAAASGYSKRELLGLNVLDLDSDMALREEVRRMWEEMPAGYLRGFQTEHRRKDGSRYPCDLTISKISFSGREYILALARDITERKQAETALRESEEHLRTTLDSIGDAVIATDVDGAINRMNPAAEALTGWTFNEVRGKQLARVLHIVNAETREPVVNPVHKVLETGKCVGLANHTVLIARDGTERQIADSAAPIRDAKGETLGVVLVFRDVTGEYHLHAKLSENERFLSSVIESIQDGISVLDCDLNIVRTNQWMEEKYGWQAPLEGKKCYEVYQGSESVCPWCPTIKALETGQAARTEVPFPNAEEPVGWIDLSAFPLKDANGDVTGVIEYIKDITERKHAEEELRKSEEEYRRLFETMSPGVIYQAADGTITSANPASERILGLTRDQLKGKTSMDPRWRMILEDGAPVPGSEHPAMLALRTGDRIGPVTRGIFVPEKEEYTWLSITAIPLFRPGEDKPFQAYATFDDITGRKRMEEALRESNRQLEAFLQVSQRITSSYELETLMQVVVDNAAEAMNIDSGAVYLLEDQDTIRLAATTPALPPDAPEKFRVACLDEHPHVKEAVTTGEYVIMPDALTATLTPAEQEIIIARNLRSNLFVPICLREESLGALILSSTGKPYTFHERDITLLQGFAGQVAQIIDSIRNYEQAQEHAADLELQIGKLKQAEAALRESEHKHRGLVEALPDIVTRVDRGGRHLFASPNVVDWTGLKPEEYIGRTGEELGFDEDVCKLWADGRRRAMETGAPTEMEYSLDTKKGPCVFNLRFVPERGKDGTVESLLCLVRDITEHRKAEQQYETLFQQMVEAFAVHEIICNEQGKPVDYRFLAVNPAFEHITGLKAEEIVGRTVLEVLPNTESYWIETYGRVALTGEPVYFERYAREFDKHYEITAFQSAPNQFACVFVDVTARKEVERELRQFKTIFDTANYGMAIATLDGTITHINEYFAACHGYAPSDLVGESSKRLHNEAQHELIERLLERSRTQGGFGPLEVPHCRRDGTVFPMLMTGQLLKDGNGAPQALAATAIDVSEMKTLEEQLYRAQRLESIGRLAGGVAHDYNNMLSVILGQTQIALEHMDESNPVSASLGEIQKAAQRSANLTRQLLAFARKQTIAPKILDLNHIISDMIKMLRHLIGEDITLTWIPGENLWPVKMDPSQIDQMLANLCVNARDAISDGGEITIETSNVSISEEDSRTASYGVRDTEPQGGDFVLLSVTDNGCGMDAETLDQIFEPFFTTKDQSKGTGLGLATIYGIVKQNDGMINVYSEPSQGTTFKIYLPACKEGAPHKQAETAQRLMPLGHETVLVAEDEPAILNVAQIVLERQGYTVLTAETPEKALTLAEQHGNTIDILITDVIMPGMNGAELANRLLALHPDLGVLFMSGYPATFTAGNKWLEEKGYFIQKPFTMKEFTTKVREVLDNR